MKDSLKTTIQKKFYDERLSEEELNALMDFQQQTQPPKRLPSNKKTRFHRLRWPSILSLAAAVCLTLGLIFNPLELKKDMPLAIAAEVAHNHFKLKPLEVKSSDLTQVNQYFTKLDFKPISSSLLNDKNYRLLGARYCSLQGITAAQIRYQTEDGKVVTFYEVSYDEKRYSHFPAIEQGQSPLVSYASGVGVKMWVEKGLLMAMTL
ncbi:MAG: hypothetical protein ACMZ64_07385 [Oleiphilus sp.]